MEAEDIGHLQHEDRKSEVFHEVIERLDQGRFQLRRQMRVNLSRTGAVMSEIFLNDAQVEACLDRKSTRLNSSHGYISYAVFCLKKKKKNIITTKLCI